MSADSKFGRRSCPPLVAPRRRRPGSVSCATGVRRKRQKSVRIARPNPPVVPPARPVFVESDKRVSGRPLTGNRAWELPPNRSKQFDVLCVIVLGVFLSALLLGVPGGRRHGACNSYSGVHPQAQRTFNQKLTLSGHGLLSGSYALLCFVLWQSKCSGTLPYVCATDSCTAPVMLLALDLCL